MFRGCERMGANEITMVTGTIAADLRSINSNLANQRTNQPFNRLSKQCDAQRMSHIRWKCALKIPWLHFACAGSTEEKTRLYVCSFVVEQTGSQMSVQRNALFGPLLLLFIDVFNHQFAFIYYSFQCFCFS